MSYEISYSKMLPQEAHNKALADIRFYVGNEYYMRVWETIIWERDHGWHPSFEQFQLALFMFPVSGYPLRALYAEVFPYG